MAQVDHAIGHELQKVIVLPAEVVVGANLLGDYGGESTPGEPIADPIDFAALGGRVVEQTQQHVDPVEDDVLGPGFGADGLEHIEKGREVEGPGLHHFR